MTDNKRASWHDAAIEDLENSSLSYEEIGRKYGRSRQTIIKLKHRYNLTRKVPTRIKGLVKAEEKRSLSSAHRSLGSRLTLYRANRTYSEVAAELNVSPYALRRMELGVYDVTLSHLLRISEVLGIDVPTLISPFTGVFRPVEVRKEK